MKRNTDQTALLRQARKKLDYTNEQLGEALGVSKPTIMSWLAPPTSKKRRSMPTGSRMLLARILAEWKAK